MVATGLVVSGVAVITRVSLTALTLPSESVTRTVNV